MYIYVFAPNILQRIKSWKKKYVAIAALKSFEKKCIFLVIPI